MQLAYVILADAAEIADNGKISLLGGEIDDIAVPTFPAFPVRLAIVVKLLVDAAECNKEHLLGIEILDPEEKPTFPAFQMPFTPQNPTGDVTKPIRSLFVFNLPLLVFPLPGRYECRIIVDDQPIGATDFRLNESAIPANAN